jgi:Fur family transcriptional regulator, peroxide stress response regulator
MARKKAGFRLTPQRLAVFEVVRDSHDHPTAREIFTRVRALRPGIGFATVYRALSLLVAHGQVLELTLGEATSTRYDGNTRQHQHVLCTSCGKAADVNVDLPPTATSDAQAASGFAVTSYDVQFLGLCRDCDR